MEEFTRLLDAGCEELGIVLTEKQKEQFFKYFQLLTEWNQVMNLTAITEMPEVVTKHFVDSLLLVRVLDQMNENSGRYLMGSVQRRTPVSTWGLEPDFPESP